MQPQQKLKTRNMTTLHLRKSIGRSPLRLALLLIPLALACFALSPTARAVCQEGCLTNNNTALGDDALLNNTGTSNTAIGFNALQFNTNGRWNTAISYQALYSGASNFNTAMGYQALYSNTGVTNTAVGYQTLFRNTYGFDNTATGETALHENTTGGLNTADGEAALFYNTTGIENTATGANALFTNKTGINNTANGSGALFSNRFGSHNTADGFNALYNNRTGAFNVALGDSAGFNITGRNNIDIGNQGIAGESDAIRIGTVGTHTATFIAGVSGATVAGGVTVVVDTNGQLGTIVSSGRFKESIKPMDKASEAILGLQPVTFRYKKELDPQGIPQFGLVAEEVEKVNPELVARDEQGKPYTVRYDAVNAMLLNEFLKEHRKVETLEAKLAKMEKDFTARLKEQDAKIQQVNDKVELSKPAPRSVL